jgi:hypothetical protein
MVTLFNFWRTDRLGVPQETIESLINAPMPDPATTVKDYASANGLDFETLKPALQAEVDKVVR